MTCVNEIIEKLNILSLESQLEVLNYINHLIFTEVDLYDSSFPNLTISSKKDLHPSF